MVYSPFELQKLFETLGINEYEIEEHHRAMVDILHLAATAYPIVFAFTMDETTYIELNQACAELFQVPYQAGLVELAQVLASYPELLSLMLSTVVEQQEYRSRLLYFERIDRLVNILVDTHSLKKDGAHLGTVFIFREITNLIQLETDLLRNDRLTTISKMAAGIAHEIRNPLTSIRGFLQLLMRDLEHAGRDKEKSYADLILTEIDRVNELLNRVLLLSKPLEIMLVNYDVNAIVKELGILHEPDAMMHHIQMQFQLGEIPQVKLDLNMFKQVLVNLIRNAVDAMENGGKLTLSTSYDEVESVVKIDVSDTGAGIPSYLLDRIFDAFFTTKEQGTGLGLAICQRNIHEFGGNIRVNSKGYGTTFSVLLPPLVRE